VNNSEPASFTNIAFETGVIAERERIIKLLDQELASGFAKAFIIGLIIGEDAPSDLEENK
jgi:hypothetical protein